MFKLLRICMRKLRIVQNVRQKRNNINNCNNTLLSVLLFGTLVSVLHFLVHIIQSHSVFDIREICLNLSPILSCTVKDSNVKIEGIQITNRGKASESENVNSLSQFSNYIDRFSIELYEYPTLQRYLMCRLKNVCIAKDGTVLLHSNFRRLRGVIRKCSIKNFKFLSDKDIDTDDIHKGTIRQNLIGIEPTAYHIPHFLTDVLPAVLAVHSNSIFNLSVISKCIHVHEKICLSSKTFNLEYNRTALLVLNRVEKMDQSSWVKQFSANIFGTHPVKFLSYATMFENCAHNMTCFQSVTTYNKQKLRFIDAGWFRSIPFTVHHEPKTASLVRRPSVNSNCKRKVVVITRKSEERRDIVNAHLLKFLIPKSSHDSWLEIEVSILLFHNLSFLEQASVLKHADIIIGAHGAALSNIVFARQGTTLIEILPFAYYAGPFVDLARSFELKYTAIIAKPDTYSFKECLINHKEKLNDSSVLDVGMEFWNRAIYTPGQSKVRHTEMNTIRSKGRYSSFLKMCARSQHLRTDLKTLSKLSMEAARQTCILKVV